MKLLAPKTKKKKGRQPFADDVLFSHVRDDYGTPQKFYDELNDEFEFAMDFAADKFTAKHPDYLGPDRPEVACRDALTAPWFFLIGTKAGFLNPPYTKTYAFLKKASEEAKHGVTTVALIPTRTDTKYWHKFVWDRKKHRTRPGVEIRFPKGRLKFTLHVTKKMRQAILDAIPTHADGDVGLKATAKALKIPLQIVRAIWNDEPEVVTSAPFPNTIVVFRPPPTRRRLTE